MLITDNIGKTLPVNPVRGVGAYPMHPLVGEHVVRQRVPVFHVLGVLPLDEEVSVST